MDRLSRFNPLPVVAALGAAVVLAASGCASLRDDMARAEEAYTATRYDHALVWLEDLESSSPDMPLEMRARFYYLRGMTAYRLQDRDDALHYLGVAREVGGDDEEALPAEWRATLDRTLTELIPEDASFRARAPRARR